VHRAAQLTNSAVAQLSPRRAPPPLATERLVSSVVLCVGNAAEHLGPAMNESHTLSVPAVAHAPIHIGAVSQHGALRALESLAHLVSIHRPGRIVNAPVQIEDSPRWGTRGLMVNPAGRFMSAAFLKRVVDGLVANKMNCE
jgi:hexosaminidase